MARTQLSTREIGSVQRNDFDVTTAGQAVVARLIAGTNITFSSTGADSGTGDVTINASSSGGSNWTITGSDIYRNSKVTVNSTTAPLVGLDVYGQTRLAAIGGMVGAPGDTSYALSVQNNAVATWIEILNNGGTGKGAFFGMTSNQFQQWNFQGGPITFHTNPSVSVGTLRMIIAADGTVAITDLSGTGTRMVVASPTGVLSTQAIPSGGGGGITTIGTIGSVPNTGGASISGATLTLQPAATGFGGVVNTVAQNFSGLKILNDGLRVGITGNATFLLDNMQINRAGLYSANDTTVADFDFTAGIYRYAGDLISYDESITDLAITGTVHISSLETDGSLNMVVTDGSGELSFAPISDVTFAPIGSTPNAQGASIVGQQITLQPASVTFGGVVSTVAQSFSGNKTFVNGLTSTERLSFNGTVAAGVTVPGDIFVNTVTGLTLRGYAGSFSDILLMDNTSSSLLIASTTQIRLMRNSSIQPASKFFLDGGLDTYFTESTPDVLKAFTNNVDRLTIDANGLIVSALDTDLTAPTQTGTVRMVTTDGTGRLSFQAIPGGGSGSPGGSDGQVQYNNGGVFGGDSAFNWDDTNKRVGIGTAAPEVSVHVSSAANSATGMLVENTSAGSTAVSRIILRNNVGETSQFAIHGGAVTGTANNTYFSGSKNVLIGTDHATASGGTSKFQVYTGGYDNSVNPQFTIDSIGRVGIGIAGPIDPLHIYKDQDAPTTLRITNHTDGPAAQANIALETNAGLATFFKVTSAYGGYKNIGATDFGLYNTSGNISFMNDAPTGNINFATGSATSAVVTINSTTLSVAPSSSKQSIKVNNFGIQSFSNDYTFLGRNLVYNGTGWEYITNGYGVIQYYALGGLGTYTAPDNVSGPGAPLAAISFVHNIGNDGQMTFAKYGLNTFTGTPTYALGVDIGGNVVEMALGGGGGGVTTMANIGAVPNAAGASISGTTLTLQPANASFGGVVTTAAQTFNGAKTFQNSATFTAGADIGTVASLSASASAPGLYTGTGASGFAMATFDTALGKFIYAGGNFTLTLGSNVGVFSTGVTSPYFQVPGGSLSGNAGFVGVSKTGGNTIAGYSTGSAEYSYGDDLLTINPSTGLVRFPRVKVDALDTDLTAPAQTGTIKMVTTDNAGILSFGNIEGNLLNVRFLTSGTTYTPTTGTTRAVLHMIGGGGGGGGTAGVASGSGAGAGGGAGAYVIKQITGVTGTYTYAIGGVGTGGAATSGTGVTGGSTTFINGGTTYTAAGGVGGVGQAATTTTTTTVPVLGGNGGAATNGDVNIAGEGGGIGIHYTAATSVSGAGGSSNLGSGGKQLISTASATGTAGGGYGGGGGGGVSSGNTNAAGGAGAPGIIVIYEYR